jgi:hypothetical protein
MLKTAYYRARSKNKKEDGYDLCTYGSLIQFKKGDYQCGLELAKMLLDAYVDDMVSVSQPTKQRVMLVLGQFPHGGDNAPPVDVLVSGMHQIKHRALVWVQKIAQSESATQQEMQALDLFRQKIHLKAGLYVSDVAGWHGFGMAMPDLIRAGDVGRLFDDGIEKSLSHAPTPVDQDMIVARVMLHILEYIPVERKSEAFSMLESVYERFVSIAAPEGNADTVTPVTQSVYYVFLAMKEGSRKLAKIAIQSLSDVVNERDPSLVQICDAVLISKYCKMYDGSMPRDPFQSMLQSLLG